MDAFTDIGVLPALAAILAERRISRPTAVQRLVIPPLLEGKKLLFRSATGTGKTLAYLLPAIQRLPSAPEGEAPRYAGPSVLICAPTFELCSQIKAEVDMLSPYPAALLIGSVSLNRQIESLKKNRPVIVAGSPGRLLVLAKMGKLKLGGLRFLALDEADRLAAEDSLAETQELLGIIERALKGGNISGAACSATVSKKTGALLSFFNGAPLLETDEQEILRERIDHWAIFSENRRKTNTLRSLLAAIKTKKAGFKALVFAARNDEAGKILSQLQHHHIPAAGLFGGMGKQERKAALDSFRAGKVKVLVSSDLAARGLDVPGITHVIALDVPEDNEIYIHRAGRTGRAGSRGIMVSIGGEQEMRRLAALEKKLRITVQPKELHEGMVCAPDNDVAGNDNVAGNALLATKLPYRSGTPV